MNEYFSFRYIMAGLSTGCLIVFNVNFNVLGQPRREPSTPTGNVQWNVFLIRSVIISYFLCLWRSIFKLFLSLLSLCSFICGFFWITFLLTFQIICICPMFRFFLKTKIYGFFFDIGENGCYVLFFSFRLLNGKKKKKTPVIFIHSFIVVIVSHIYLG